MLHINWKKSIVLAALAASTIFATAGADARERKYSAADSGDVSAVQAFAPGSSYQLCFVPDGASCTATLVQLVDATQSLLLIQAYEFTSKPIAEAVVRAKKRGVDVRVIVDKELLPEDVRSKLSGRGEKSKGFMGFDSEPKKRMKSSFDVARFFVENNVPVVVDLTPAIAHNKLMIADSNLPETSRQAVFTGSFNFTVRAQEVNAENGVIIRGDRNIVKSYVDNWSTRWRASTPYKNLVSVD